MMQNIELSETIIKQGNGKSFKVAILRANVPCRQESIASINKLMDEAVSKYVEKKGHNTFIEINKDTPNLRVVISDINDIDFKPFDYQIL